MLAYWEDMSIIAIHFELFKMCLPKFEDNGTIQFKIIQ